MNTKQRNVWVFFSLTVLLTWGFYLPIAILGLSPYQGTGMILLICGGCMPTVVGFLMAMITYGKAGRLDYLRRSYDVRRIKPGWWGMILLLYPVLLTVSIAIDGLLGGIPPEMSNLKAVLANPVVFFPLVLLSFMSGPFSEELGWRGFALEPLLERFGFTRASVLLGLIWGVWHLPLYFMPETWHGKMGFQPTGFWTFLLLSVGLSMIMSYVYIHTNRSILSAILLHLSGNFSTQLIAGTISPGYSPRIELIRTLLILAIGTALCVHAVRTEKVALRK